MNDRVFGIGFRFLKRFAFTLEFTLYTNSVNLGSYVMLHHTGDHPSLMLGVACLFMSMDMKLVMCAHSLDKPKLVLMEYDAALKRLEKSLKKLEEKEKEEKKP